MTDLGSSTSGSSTPRALLDSNRPIAKATDVTVRRYAELVVRGGWPLNLTRSVAAAARAKIDHVATITEVDLPTIDPARRHPRLALRLLQALARNVGMDYVVTNIAQEASDDDSEIARSTVYDYLAPLERLMVLVPLETWSSHLRSRARLRTSPRVQFCDPSVAVAALRAGPDELLGDLNFFEYLFEALVVRDLRVFADAVDGTVRHYRDSDDLDRFRLRLHPTRRHRRDNRCRPRTVKLRESTITDETVPHLVERTGGRPGGRSRSENTKPPHTGGCRGFG